MGLEAGDEKKSHPLRKREVFHAALFMMNPLQMMTGWWFQPL